MTMCAANDERKILTMVQAEMVRAPLNKINARHGPSL